MNAHLPQNHVARSEAANIGNYQVNFAQFMGYQ
jgi:hypothetical protein